MSYKRVPMGVFLTKFGERFGGNMYEIEARIEENQRWLGWWKQVLKTTAPESKEAVKHNIEMHKLRIKELKNESKP